MYLLMGNIEVMSRSFTDLNILLEILNTSVSTGREKRWCDKQILETNHSKHVQNTIEKWNKQQRLFPTSKI